MIKLTVYINEDKIKAKSIVSQSLIGRKYYPFDNSYCVNLTQSSNYPYSNKRNVYLAGTLLGDPVKECIIVSEPFKCKVKSCVGNEIYEHDMIMVNYNNHTYSVMFHKQGLTKHI